MMELNSFNFVISFALLFLVLLAAEGIKRRTGSSFLSRFQIFLLLLFSYFFIYASDRRFCLCTAAVTLFSYLTALCLDRYSGSRRKVILSAGTAVLVLVLGFFKYANFFAESFAPLFGRGRHISRVFIPLGISFYIFSAISYLIDVYRAKYRPVRNFIDFALYISFFPKMTAGPIVRGSEFFPQIENYRGIRASAFSAGIQIFVLGLFKKLVLADRLGVFVNDIFYAPAAYNTGSVILGIISYSLQIYFDFSGYSDMAAGIAKIVGFDFGPNFNLPYIADGISDFWRRWHISLSSWFMDYLYIPLGGSRKGRGRTYLNLILVMLISGLWHGAGLTFVLWGLLHGLVSCAEHLSEEHGHRLPRGLSIALTYITVSLLWVLFRADSPGNALEVFRAAFTFHSGVSQPYVWSFFAFACLAAEAAGAYMHGRKTGALSRDGRTTVNVYYRIADLHRAGSLTLFFVFCGLTLILGYFGNTAFIYGKF